MKSLMTFIAVLMALIVVLLGGCKDTAPSGPAPGLGSATISKYVAIGNSITAGYQSNGLYQSAQVYSFPNLLAQQITAAGGSIGKFEQPLWSDPGTPDPTTGKASRYEIISLVGPVIGPKGLTAGSPTNLALARPYDNLGIPGAVIYDFLDTTSFTAKAGPPRNNSLFLATLRNAALGKNILGQARALHPDLVTFWLGNNDVLGYATSGGTSPSSPTSNAVFAALYAQALDSLRAALPTAKILVANIPDVAAIPFFTTIGPKMAAGIPAPYYLRYQKHGNTGLSFDSTRLTESGAPLITLKGSLYASYLGHGGGQGGGKWYSDNGIPLGAGIDTTKPFGFHPQNPWPDALTLDAGEVATSEAAVASFNSTIASVAAAKNAGLVDINALFNNIKRNGYFVAGQEYTADYVSGGLFSLDGVHPSDRGHALVANEFIKVLNSKFGTNLPYIDLASLPGIPAPVASLGKGTIPVVPYDAFRDFDWLWSPSR